MNKNKTIPTGVSVDTYLAELTPLRHEEAHVLIGMMAKITGKSPYMWGPSIIGFGTQHYKYETGREGDMPDLAFSPRKASITIYFSEGFNRYSDDLKKLGKCKQSVSCLYINKLDDINLDVLKTMLVKSLEVGTKLAEKPTDVDGYILTIPAAARPKFDELRTIVKAEIPEASEVLSYGIIGYKIDDKRARVYISGWKDHLSIYPVPSNPSFKAELEPYVKGRGTLWFGLNKPLPKKLIISIVRALVS